MKELDRNEREKKKDGGLKGGRGRKTGKKRKEYDRAIEQERERVRGKEGRRKSVEEAHLDSVTVQYRSTG